MSDITISYKGNYIDTKAKPDDIAKKGINDKGSVTDNVLDISNAERIPDELNTQDLAKIKFIKVGNDKYVEVDLSNPAERNRLVSDLKKAMLENGTLKKGFTGTRFQANTGIVISNKETGSVSSSSPSSEKHVDYSGTRTALAQEMSGLIDIDKTMTTGDYNKTMQMPTTIRKKSGYFATIQNKLAEQEKTIDKTIEKINSTKPVDTAELDKFQKLKNLNQSLQDLYGQIKVSQNYKNRMSDATAVMDKIGLAWQNLAKVDANDIGKANYDKIEKSLTEYSQLAIAFPGLGGNPAANTDSMLDMFTLKTYFRLNQIQDKNRVRANETPDIQGALNTYGNDASDMVTFIQRFNQLDQKLAKGEFKNNQEFVSAMLAAVPRTSPDFIKSVGNLANAKWNSYQAQVQMANANNKVQDAAKNANLAYSELQKANSSLGEGVEKYRLSQSEIEQDNLTSARSVLTKSDDLRKQAYGHLAEYEKYKAQGLQSSAEAIALKNKAMGFIRLSDSYNTLVKNGKYSEPLKSQTSQVDQQNHALREQAKAIMENVNTIRQNFSAWDKDKEKIVTGLEALGGAIKLGDLEIKTKDMVKNGIDQSRKKINDLMSNPKYGLTENAKKYLKDPASVDEKYHSEIKEELTKVIKNNPELATAISKEIGNLKSDFSNFRRDLEKQYGNKPEYTRALDMMEKNLIEGWFEKSGVLMEALVSAAHDSPEIRNAMNGNYQWLFDVQGKYSKMTVADPETDKQISDGFHKSMMGREDLKDMRESYNSFKEKYGEPVDRLHMSLVANDSGRVVDFNAYVFYDKDSKEYKVFNPLDKAIYTGKTTNEALENLTKEARIVDGTLNYKDKNNVVHSAKMTAPTDTSTWDNIAAVSGLVAGAALMLIPEPTVTKVAGGALIASSAYFLTKGTINMVDLVKHEKFGNNKETWSAAIDIASGLLGPLDGAGAILQSTKGASLVLKATTIEARLASGIRNIAASSGIKIANGTVLAAGLGLAGKEIADIYNNKKLSPEQKIKMSTQIVVSSLMPIGLMAASHSLNNSRFSKQVHNEFLGKMTGMEVMLKASGENMPDNFLKIRDVALPELQQMKKFYETKVTDPALKAEGLAKIQAMEKLFEGTKVEVHDNMISGVNKAAETLKQVNTSTPDAGKTLVDMMETAKKARTFYESPAMDKEPLVKKQGLEKIKLLEENIIKVKDQLHADMTTELTKGGETLANTPKDTPKISKAIAEAEASIERAKKFYESPLMEKFPEIKNAGLEKIKSLEASLAKAKEEIPVNYNPETNTYKPHPSQAANDVKRGVLLNTTTGPNGEVIGGEYIKNPSAVRLDSLKIENGKIKMEPNHKKGLNGEFMYVIDKDNNIIIGTRSEYLIQADGTIIGKEPPLGSNGIAREKARLREAGIEFEAVSHPHPTLIGGANPEIKAAGIVKFEGGKIKFVDNGSGHFMPGESSLKAAEEAFKKLGDKIFIDPSKTFMTYDKHSKE